MTNQISASDYRDIKSDYGNTLAKLQAKFSGLNSDQDDVEILLNQGIENLYRLNSIYQKSKFVECRDLIGSIYPENLIFDRVGFRTTKINEAVQLMYLINEQLDSNKKRQIRIFLICLLWWAMRGSNPRPPRCKRGALNQLS